MGNEGQQVRPASDATQRFSQDEAPSRREFTVYGGIPRGTERVARRPHSLAHVSSYTFHTPKLNPSVPTVLHMLCPAHLWAVRGTCSELQGLGERVSHVFAQGEGSPHPPLTECIT